jgi:hypothetical protein
VTCECNWLPQRLDFDAVAFLRIERAASGYGKIDPLMALFNAAALMAMNPDAGSSVYEEHGIHLGVSEGPMRHRGIRRPLAAEQRGAIARLRAPIATTVTAEESERLGRQAQRLDPSGDIRRSIRPPRSEELRADRLTSPHFLLRSSVAKGS